MLYRSALLSGVGDEETIPDQGIEPIGKRGGPYRAVAGPALWLLGAEQLFDIPEGDLDGPASAVQIRYLKGTRREIGREEIVVLLVAGWVAHDDQQDGDPTPDPRCGNKSAAPRPARSGSAW